MPRAKLPKKNGEDVATRPGIPPITGAKRIRFMDCIAKGYTFEHACAAAGVSHTVLNRVLAYGRWLFEQYSITENESVFDFDTDDFAYYDFYREFLENRALAAGEFLEARRQLALEMGDDRAIDWFLKTVFGKDFKYSRDDVEASERGKTTHVTNILIVPPEEYGRLEDKRSNRFLQDVEVIEVEPDV